MTAKRKRRRSRSSSAGSSPKQADARVAQKDDAGGSEKTKSERASPPESPFPPLAASLARGLRVVGASPTILATAFLSLLLTWAAFVLLGVDPNPGTLALLVAVPPAQVLFTDAAPVLGPAANGTAIALTVAGIAALRGITFALMCLLITQALRSGRTSLPNALKALPRASIVLAGVYLIEFGMVVAVFLLLFPFLGQLAVLLLVPAGLYFLVFALVVAVAEGNSTLPALRRGLRAARLPGTRHLWMVMAYFLVLYYARVILPFGILAPATPSIGIWAFSLAMTFIHVSVLAAFAYRWLAVRDKVPSAPAPGRG